jgi:hypothetical protein
MTSLRKVIALVAALTVLTVSAVGAITAGSHQASHATPSRVAYMCNPIFPTWCLFHRST